MRLCAPVDRVRPGRDPGSRHRPDPRVRPARRMNRRGPLAGQVAIVTGSSKGIGAAAALAVTQAGAAVTVTGRTPGGGPGSVGATAARVRESGGQALAVVADITNEADVSRVFESTVQAFGGVDVLVNNAGVFHLGKPLAELSLREWDEMIDVNLRGVFLCCRAPVPLLAGRGAGSLIHITSPAPHWGFPSTAP